MVLRIFGYGSLIWKNGDFPRPFTKRYAPCYVTGFLRRFWHGSSDHRGTVEAPGRVVTLITFEEWRERFKELEELNGCGTLDITSTATCNKKRGGGGGGGGSELNDTTSIDETCRVYGVVYEFAEEDEEVILSYLGYREKNGYIKVEGVSIFLEELTKQSTGVVHGEGNHNPSNGRNDEPSTTPPPLLLPGCSLFIAPTSDPDFLGPPKDGLQGIAKQIVRSHGPSGSNLDYLLGLTLALRKMGRLDDHLRALEELVNEEILFLSQDKEREGKEKEKGRGESTLP